MAAKGPRRRRCVRGQRRPIPTPCTAGRARRGASRQPPASGHLRVVALYRHSQGRPLGCARPEHRRHVPAPGSLALPRRAVAARGGWGWSAALHGSFRDRQKPAPPPLHTHRPVSSPMKRGWFTVLVGESTPIPAQRQTGILQREGCGRRYVRRPSGRA